MKGETWFDLVKFHFPDATEAEVESMLWSCCAFPCATPDHVDKQLHELRQKANCPADAISLSYAEFDHAWEESRAEREAEEFA